jgi:hypothetical protein
MRNLLNSLKLSMLQHQASARFYFVLRRRVKLKNQNCGAVKVLCWNLPSTFKNKLEVLPLE